MQNRVKPSLVSKELPAWGRRTGKQVFPIYHVFQAERAAWSGRGTTKKSGRLKEVWS